MLDQGLDQAAGLRRMVAQPGLNLMAFPIAAGGSELWIAQLAHSLRALGARPVVVDAGRGGVTRAFGLNPRHELLDLMQGGQTFDNVAQSTSDGVYVLRAERGVEAFVASGAPAQQLFTSFARLSHGFDALLLAMPAGELACLASPTDCIPVLSLEAGDEALMRAYGTLKQLATGFGYRRFALVTQGAGTAEQARNAHGRLASAARSFLDCDVSLAGSLPAYSNDAEPALAELAQTLLHTAAQPLSLH